MKIRELLSDESKWCRGSLSLDKEGNKIDPIDSQACCWCLYGACMKCYDFYNNIIEKILIKIGCYIDDWNDKSTFQEVKNLVEELDI